MNECSSTITPAMWQTGRLEHGWFMDDFGKLNVEYCKFKYKPTGNVTRAEEVPRCQPKCNLTRAKEVQGCQQAATDNVGKVRWRDDDRTNLEDSKVHPDGSSLIGVIIKTVRKFSVAK